MRLQLRFAYCTTIHARQGSEDRSIIYVMPYDLQYEHRQTLYTGLTRARENVFFLGQVTSPSSLVCN